MNRAFMELLYATCVVLARLYLPSLTACRLNLPADQDCSFSSPAAARVGGRGNPRFVRTKFVRSATNGLHGHAPAGSVAGARSHPQQAPARWRGRGTGAHLSRRAAKHVILGE